MLAPASAEKLPALFETYCFDCHADGLKKGDFSFDRFPDVASMQANRKHWQRVVDQLRYNLMPPADETQPKAEDREAMLQWVKSNVFPIDPAHPNPGRMTLRRLNRHEYRNTVQYLTGVMPNISVLPADDSGYGFDNIGDVLSLAPVHLDAYQATASQTLEIALAKSNQSQLVDLDLLEGECEIQDDHLLISHAAVAQTQINLAAGSYELQVELSAELAGPEPARVRLALGNETKELTINTTTPRTYSVSGSVEAGDTSLRVELLNDFWDEKTGADMNLRVHRITVIGPISEKTPTSPIFLTRNPGEETEPYRQRCLSHFMVKAFRRPVPPDEVQRYLTLAPPPATNAAVAINESLLPALEAVLISPHFLFREMQRITDPGKAGEIRPVNEFTLASRLSYFLWSSSPDEALLAAAQHGQLRQQLDSQVQRLLASDGSRQLVDRFFNQWLQFGDIQFLSYDSKRFPAFRSKLRQLFREETRLFCADLLESNAPIDRLLDADYTFVNERLAEHYGMPAVSGDDMRRVQLSSPQRRGILGHGSILAVTSNPNRTSPVKRGKWVLENLLDSAPPPPPPNVPSLPPPHSGESPGNLRAQLELHRRDPACASCHKLMDGIGFAFEGFEVDGSQRPPSPDLDTRGTLASGETVDSPAALAAVLLKQRQHDFHRAFAVKLLTFALGRGLEYYDEPAIETIISRAAADQYRVHAYIKAVIESVPFQQEAF